MNDLDLVTKIKAKLAREGCYSCGVEEEWTISGSPPRSLICAYCH